LTGQEPGADKQADRAALWALNLDRLNQLLRDRTIEQAATRRIDRYRQLLRDSTIEQAATRRIDR
jgi:hypothetical protein